MRPVSQAGGVREVAADLNPRDSLSPPELTGGGFIHVFVKRLLCARLRARLL